MSEYQEEKAPPLTTIANFRDVASLIENIKPGLLYRSANLDDASLEDLDNLRERYRIKSIIDLRGMNPWPMISTWQLPGKHNSDYTYQYPDCIACTSILGLRLHYIALAGPQYGKYVASQIGFWNKTKAIAEIAFMPESGVKNYKKLVDTKMCKERMAIPEAIMDHSFPQIKAVFKILVDPSSYPVLVLNRYGTDLVSMIVSMVLFVLDADTASIHRDYMQTYEELADSKQERLEYQRGLGVANDSLVDAYIPFVNSLDKYIRDKHGGIEQYLWKIGITQSELQTLRNTLQSGSSLSEKQGWLVDV
ncbi:hypothetical protein KCU81_g7076, partial [Aureobasidium melanogenum]|uniref:Uncharacterized protein n=1 Tax=Aureobasidium melanogenum (strain CBS 110374) TaxID=1043003 RepID=A0A074VKP5_AURM1